MCGLVGSDYGRRIRSWSWRDVAPVAVATLDAALWTRWVGYHHQHGPAPDPRRPPQRGRPASTTWCSCRPTLDRTTAAIEALGLPLRRTRD